MPHARHVASLLLLALTTHPLAAQQPRPDGTWELLVPPPESLPPLPALLIPALGARGGPLGGPPRGWGGGRPRDLSERDLLRRRQTLRLAFAAPVRVQVDRRAKELVTVDSAGVERHWRIGATTVRAPADSDGAEGAVHTHVHWKDDLLVVDLRVDGGGRVRESYGTGLDGRRLLVYVSVTTDGLPLEFRREYRRVE